MDFIPLKEKPEDVMSQLVTILKKQFKKHLLLVGAKGSLARNDFTPYSDFDLIIVVDQDELEQWPEFMYKTTYLDVQVISLAHVLNIIRNVSPTWPAEAGGKLNMMVYFDKNDTYKKIKDAFSKVKRNKKLFEKVISLNTTIEYYSKAIRYYNDKEYDNLRWACGWLFEEFSMILALLNQRYFTIQGPSAKIREISTFQYLPLGWKQISQDLVSANPSKNIKGTKNLMKLLGKLSKKHSFADYKINSIKDIRFRAH